MNRTGTVCTCRFPSVEFDRRDNNLNMIYKMKSLWCGIRTHRKYVAERPRIKPRDCKRSARSSSVRQGAIKFELRKGSAPAPRLAISIMTSRKYQQNGLEYQNVQCSKFYGPNKVLCPRSSIRGCPL